MASESEHDSEQDDLGYCLGFRKSFAACVGDVEIVDNNSTTASDENRAIDDPEDCAAIPMDCGAASIFGQNNG